MPTETWVVDGLRDEKDMKRVRQALGDVWGIRQVVFNSRQSEVTITYDDEAGAGHDFAQAIRSCGFDISAPRGPLPTDERVRRG